MFLEFIEPHLVASSWPILDRSLRATEATILRFGTFCARTGRYEPGSAAVGITGCEGRRSRNFQATTARPSREVDSASSLKLSTTVRISETRLAGGVSGRSAVVELMWTHWRANRD
jgi:hypothetical protein